ncbi:MAG: hypothetical protein JWR55_1054 [Aeromicrobium sp.]|nr:hypothetical protein [Aeromicrobium sp.]
MAIADGSRCDRAASTGITEPLRTFLPSRRRNGRWCELDGRRHSQSVNLSSLQSYVGDGEPEWPPPRASGPSGWPGSTSRTLRCSRGAGSRDRHVRTSRRSAASRVRGIRKSTKGPPATTLVSSRSHATTGVIPPPAGRANLRRSRHVSGRRDGSAGAINGETWDAAEGCGHPSRAVLSRRALLRASVRLGARMMPRGA